MLDYPRTLCLAAILICVAPFLVITVTRVVVYPHEAQQQWSQPQKSEQTKSVTERSTAGDGLWNTNPDLPVSEILNNIKTGAVKSTAGGPSLSYMLAPFSALLVNLANKADESSRRLEELTQRLYVVTIALLVVTIVLLVVTVVPLVCSGNDRPRFPLPPPTNQSHRTEAGRE
jgi:hypothetical protein